MPLHRIYGPRHYNPGENGLKAGIGKTSKAYSAKTIILAPEMYAILDIETTGGKYNEEGITEIAIYRFDGHDITDRFVSLVNPERQIQPFVVKLTGIDNHMLRSAPKFHEVAKRIVEITEGCVLVAHNVAFDYRMLRTEFKRLGFRYVRKTLCTVTLSQKLIPGKEAYSLGKLARSLGIPLSDRHRADGDARATAALFKLLLAKDGAKTIIKKAVDGNPLLNTTWLNILDGLPNVTGVYYVHNNDGAIVYIGEGKNIRSAVNRHFTGDSTLAKTIQKEVALVTYEETPTMLIAGLKAYREIRENNPPCNLHESESIPEKTRGNHGYPHKNMIVIDKGRETDERSVLLIENSLFKGFGYINLNYQIKNIRILRSIITPVEHTDEVNRIVISYLLKNRKLKIVPF